MGSRGSGYNIFWMVKNIFSLIHSNSPEDQIEAISSPEFRAEHALVLLRKRNLAPGVIEEISSKREVVDKGRVKLMMVIHPRTPIHLAMDFVGSLLPMELLEVLKSPTAKPPVKKKAELIILENMEKYPLGLRIALARLAPARAHRIFIREKSEEVLKAFMRNPYLKEETVLYLLERKDLPPGFLSFIYKNTKWGLSPRVKLKIVLSPSSPVPLALRIINELGVNELREIKKDPAQPEIILRRVNLLLGKEV